MECNRCGDPGIVINSDAFCVECDNADLCVICFATHVVEIINDLEWERQYRDRNYRPDPDAVLPLLRTNLGTVL